MFKIAILFTLPALASASYTVNHCRETAKSELNKIILEDVEYGNGRRSYCSSPLFERVVETIQFEEVYTEISSGLYTCKTKANVVFRCVRGPW